MSRRASGCREAGQKQDRRRYQLVLTELENGETPEVAFNRRWNGQKAGPTKGLSRNKVTDLDHVLRGRI